MTLLLLAGGGLLTSCASNTDCPYDVGIKDGRVLWVARDCFAVTKKVGECREAHGMGYVTDEQIGEKRKAIDHE